MVEKKEPLVSVIVPVFNNEKSIKWCIESILHSTYRNLEVIVIIDGATDSSEQIAKSFCEDERVNIVIQKNQGVSEARNNGLALAQGEYISFVDADDVIHCRMYSMMINVAELYCADVIQCNHVLTDKDYDEIDTQKELGDEDPGILVLDAKEWGRDVCGPDNKNLFVWNKLYRRSSISSCSFRYKCGEDFVFCIDIAKIINSVIRLDCPLYYWVENMASASHQKPSEWHINVVETMMKVYKELLVEKSELSTCVLVKLWKQALFMRFCVKKNINIYDRIDGLLNVFYMEYRSEFWGNKDISRLKKCIFVLFLYYPKIYELYRKWSSK